MTPCKQRRQDGMFAEGIWKTESHGKRWLGCGHVMADYGSLFTTSSRMKSMERKKEGQENHKETDSVSWLVCPICRTFHMLNQ